MRIITSIKNTFSPYWDIKTKNTSYLTTSFSLQTILLIIKLPNISTKYLPEQSTYHQHLFLIRWQLVQKDVFKKEISLCMISWSHFRENLWFILFLCNGIAIFCKIINQLIKIKLLKTIPEQPSPCTESVCSIPLPILLNLETKINAL